MKTFGFKAIDRKTMIESLTSLGIILHHDPKTDWIEYDPAVLDTDGLEYDSSPIQRMIKAAVFDDKGEFVSPPEYDRAFYAVVRLLPNEAGDFLAAMIDKGGTVNSSFKLPERIEMKEERKKMASDDPRLKVKTVRSRKIGDVTVFPIGGEDGMLGEDFGRIYL